jgi:chaperone modulatory protein CbpM
MEQDILTGSVIGDEAVLSLEDFARACPAEVSWIAELVEVDVLTPHGTELSSWRFRAADLICARRVARLQRDFGASTEAVAVMLDLLTEIERLRACLKRVGLDVDEGPRW